MATIYKGDEHKFAIKLEAEGFSMDTDDFEIEIIGTGKSLKGYKNPTAGSGTDVIIYKETTGQGEEQQSTWYCIVDTSKLNAGNLRAVATAYIPDAHANDGVRKELAVAALDRLIDP